MALIQHRMRFTVLYGSRQGQNINTYPKQNNKTQNKITKLKTESQNPKTESKNPKQNHKTQNRITKLKTETQNSKQNPQSEKGAQRTKHRRTPLPFLSIQQRAGGERKSMLVMRRSPLTFFAPTSTSFTSSFTCFIEPTLIILGPSSEHILKRDNFDKRKWSALCNLVPRVVRTLGTRLCVVQLQKISIPSPWRANTKPKTEMQNR